MMRFRRNAIPVLLCMVSASATSLFASETGKPFTLNYSAGIEANGGPENFSPYYVSALRDGKITSGRGMNLDLKVWRPIDLGSRFSYAFGIEGIGRLANSIDYQRYNLATNTWGNNNQSTSAVWLHQLYATVKYRGVYLTAGLHEQHSALLNQRLSSGDLTESGNTRPIPGARIGFIDFQNIPFTNGWVQIQGEIGYYRSTDDSWQQNRYNYWNYHITRGWWYNYKRMYFRTKPTEHFSVTLGMQASAQFAGYVDYYNNGIISENSPVGRPLSFRDFFDMLVPREGDTYVVGNHLGSWDLMAQYRLNSGDEIKAYFQWPWEDGSGIGKLNGWDGLWGVEWKPAKRGPVTGAVLEFMTYMNQSGPMHYDYDDHPGTNLNGNRATGADNYYNNAWYNGYAIYGLSIGSPMFPAPARNTDGSTTRFLQNRFWGFHGAVEGDVTNELSYRILAGYRRFYGTMFIPSINTTHCVSALVEASWCPPRIPGLKLSAQLAFDAGNSLYGDNFGALVSATYSGIFNTKNAKFTPCVL